MNITIEKMIYTNWKKCGCMFCNINMSWIVSFFKPKQRLTMLNVNNFKIWSPPHHIKFAINSIPNWFIPIFLTNSSPRIICVSLYISNAWSLKAYKEPKSTLRKEPTIHEFTIVLFTCKSVIFQGYSHLTTRLPDTLIITGA